MILMKNQLCWSVEDIKNLKLNGRKLGEVKNDGDSMHVSQYDIMIIPGG